MVALQWGLLTPVPVERLVVFAAPARTSAQAIACADSQSGAVPSSESAAHSAAAAASSAAVRNGGGAG